MYYNVCNKFRKFNIIKTSYIKKTLSLAVAYNKCGHEYEKNI